MDAKEQPHPSADVAFTLHILLLYIMMRPVIDCPLLQLIAKPLQLSQNTRNTFHKNFFDI